MPSILKSLIQKYFNIYDVYGHIVCVNAQFYKTKNRKHVSDDNTRLGIEKT